MKGIMNTILQADIFFFISTILLAAATVVFIVAIVYVIKILKEARSIAALVRREGERIAADIDTFRDNLREEGMSPSGVFSFVSGLVKKGKAFGQRKRSRKSD